MASQSTAEVAVVWIPCSGELPLSDFTFLTWLTECGDLGSSGRFLGVLPVGEVGFPLMVVVLLVSLLLMVSGGCSLSPLPSWWREASLV